MGSIYVYTNIGAGAGVAGAPSEPPWCIGGNLKAIFLSYSLAPPLFASVRIYRICDWPHICIHIDAHLISSEILPWTSNLDHRHGFLTFELPSECRYPPLELKYTLIVSAGTQPDNYLLNGSIKYSNRSN